jgi:hypothetical protein
MTTIRKPNTGWLTFLGFFSENEMLHLGGTSYICPVAAHRSRPARSAGQSSDSQWTLMLINGCWDLAAERSHAFGR